MSKLIWTIFLGTSAVHAQVLGPPPSPTPSQLSCAANIASAPTIHAEGMTELVGDITLICTGGAATTAGAAVPSINVTLFFNTSVTSRLYANGWSEALLLIDEPGSGLPGTTNTQLACNDPNGSCPLAGTGTGAGVYDGSPGRPNIFPGRVSGNSVTFPDIPVDPPGSPFASRVFRITNIRVNATSLSGGTGFGTPVVASIAGANPAILPLTSPTLTVAFIQPGLDFSVRAPDTSTAGGLCVSAQRAGVLRFSEVFGTAFKNRTDASFASGDTSPSPLPQTIPGSIHYGESGFYNPALSAPAVNFTTAGLADSGTRLRAAINAVPPGAKVFVSTRNVAFTGGVPAVVNTGAVARLIQNEMGAFTPASATSVIEGLSAVQLPVINGSASAVWEVLGNSPNAIETLDFMVWVQASGVGVVGTVSGSFAPAPPAFSAASGVLASDTLSIPRFIAGATPSVNLSTSAACAALTTTSLTSFAQNAATGSPVILTATVTSLNPLVSGVPAGTVTFYDGGAAMPGGTVTLNSGGVAVFASGLADGVHAITAKFSPTANFQAPSASAPLSVFASPSNGSSSSMLFTQQGGKLVTSGAIGRVQQGTSVALSADGNTLLVGGPSDNGGVGAAWVYTRINGAWKQQAKLVGAGAVGISVQGFSVALSADGNTAISGGLNDDSGNGAVWVFVRANGAWTQQGNKLTGAGADGASGQGVSVALSADGSTVIVGGALDSRNVGAAWVFTRDTGVWTQQGPKLVASGFDGQRFQGQSVSLAADGNTAVIGAPFDSLGVGAARVFVRTNGVWSQEGPKLVGSGAVGTPLQGTSVAMSADGSTVIVGGRADSSDTGAIWVFTRFNDVWTQAGPKLVGLPAVSGGSQGKSVAVSADGKTVLVGASGDNNSTGATWVFARTDGVWSQSQPKLVGSGAAAVALQGSAVAISSNGDTAAIGGPTDDGTLTSFIASAGAVWIFAKPVPTTTTLSSSAPFEGQVTLNATVSSTNLNLSGPPAGAVTFYDGRNAIPASTTSLNSGGSAAFTTSLGGGIHRISAVFSSANSLLLPSASPEIAATSSGRTTPTLDLTSSKSPSNVGQFVNFTAAVSIGEAIPTGAVEFTDGSQSLGIKTLVNGQATLQTTLSSAGTHSIYAFYSGDLIYSDVSARFGQIVNRATPALALTLAPAAAEFGQPVSFSAQMSWLPLDGVAAPSGQIEIFEGSTPIGSAPLSASLSSGSMTLNIPNLSVGPHQIFALFGGDGSWYSVRSASVTAIINRAATATVLTGTTQAMTATVVAAASGFPAVPTGTVQFINAGSNAIMASLPLTGGKATTSVAAAGKIVAVYSGDGSFAPSTSGPMVWATVVNAASFTSTGFAPEQSATIFGADFPAAPTVTVADDGGTARIAKVTFASPAQINFVIPASLPDGPAIVAVGGQTVPIMIVKVAPGLFPNGLQIIRVRPDGSQTLEDATAPITMGADTLYLALYGTGVRNRSDLKNVTCTINGLSLPVVFAGAQPEFPGLDQIDLLLPVSLSGAGKVDVSLAVDGQTSNTVTLSFQ